MNQAILDKVFQSSRLPSLPTIAVEVIDLVQRKDVNIKQIAHTISHDPALSSKILKTVNSSFYGQSHSISTISHALVILGLNSVKTLALGFSLLPHLKDGGGESFDHVDFWKRSVYSAVAARTLARQMGVIEQEEAFLGGLLQDLGVLAMNQTLGREYRAITAEAGAEHHRLWPIERARLRTDHAEIGAALAEHWNLPRTLVAPVRFHEEPQGAPLDLMPLVRCVALGSHLADVFVNARTRDAMDRFEALAGEWFRLDHDRCEALIKSAAVDGQEVRRLFDLPAGELDNADEILARANEALLQISLQQERQASELQEQNKQLAEQAVTDSLTGAANRRRFNEFIAAQFELAQDGSGPLSLLFLDADHFKGFNDTYGHPAGDRVLIEVAGVLKRTAPAGALVARYGGEEFAVVLPNTPRVEAARLAETARRTVEAAQVRSDEGRDLRVTASIGVATLERGVFTRVEQLIKAADQAVYAAKASGRNCVRVFTPKSRPAPAAA